MSDERTVMQRSQVYPRSPLGESVEGIPTGRDVEWEPLVDYRRNGVSETTIHGAVAWGSGDDIVHSFGGNVLCYGRSMMKPIMLKVFAEELDGEFLDLYATHLKLDGRQGLSAEAFLAELRSAAQPG